VRHHMLQAGARALGQLLSAVGRGRRSEPLICAENHLPKPMGSRGLRQKTLHTVLGPVEFRRSKYVCDICDKVRYPADEQLGVMRTGFSPGSRRMLARAGSQESFDESAQDLRLFADLEVDAKSVERVAEGTGRVVDDWMAREAARARLLPLETEHPDTLYVSFDGTGVPMRREELDGVPGKGPDGKAKTREAKLGCVFTQTTLDEKGRPMRDPASTTYVGAIENSTEFGYRIFGEAVRRGMKNARRVVLLTDGASYNKTIAAEHFPGAIHILDLYHARENLAKFTRESCLSPLEGARHRECGALLDAGELPALLAKMDEALPRSGLRRTEGRKKIAYFRGNAHAMRYAEFRAMDLFVGSGVIEAGCKNVIGRRLKQSGMFWSERGANAIIALRCCFASGRFEQFWEDAGS